MVMSDAADESELNPKFSFGMSDLNTPAWSGATLRRYNLMQSALRVTRRSHRLHAKSEAED